MWLPWAFPDILKNHTTTFPCLFPASYPLPLKYFQLGSCQKTLQVTYGCLLLSYCSTKILADVDFYLTAVFLTPRGAKQ